MTRGDRKDGPVGEEDYEAMRERISRHFDRMRELLEREIDDSDA